MHHCTCCKTWTSPEGSMLAVPLRTCLHWEHLLHAAALPCQAWRIIQLCECWASRRQCWHCRSLKSCRPIIECHYDVLLCCYCARIHINIVPSHQEYQRMRESICHSEHLNHLEKAHLISFEVSPISLSHIVTSLVVTHTLSLHFMVTHTFNLFSIVYTV